MSNLPMVPGVPSRADVDAMKKAMQALNAGSNVPATYTHEAHYSGGSTGRQRINESYTAPSYYPGGGTSAEDVQQMKNLLERLNEINGDYEPKQTVNESHQVTGEAYYVSECLVESNGQEKPAFNVVSGSSNQVVAETLSIKEAAQAVSKFLNKGLALNSPKVQEVLELEETYYRSRIEAGVTKGRYQRAVKLGESEAAEVFKARFNKVKAEALLAQDQIKSILAAIR